MPLFFFTSSLLLYCSWWPDYSCLIALIPRGPLTASCSSGVPFPSYSVRLSQDTEGLLGMYSTLHLHRWSRHLLHKWSSWCTHMGGLISILSVNRRRNVEVNRPQTQVRCWSRKLATTIIDNQYLKLLINWTFCYIVCMYLHGSTLNLSVHRCGLTSYWVEIESFLISPITLIYCTCSVKALSAYCLPSQAQTHHLLNKQFILIIKFHKNNNNKKKKKKESQREMVPITLDTLRLGDSNATLLRFLFEENRLHKT